MWGFAPAGRTIRGCPWPQWSDNCREIAKLGTPDDRGIGDVIERLIREKTKRMPAGKTLIEQFGAANTFWDAVRHTVGAKCGCEYTRESLNYVFPLSIEDVILDSRLPRLGWSVHSPGDETIMTGIIANLHAAYPCRFRTFYRTALPEIWQGNPHQTNPERMIRPRPVFFGFNVEGTNDPADKTGLGRPMHFMDVRRGAFRRRLALRSQ